MPANGLWKSRYGPSVDGWSAVDKVAQFSQAVGRVSGGRGSAILVAMMDNNGQLMDATSAQRVGAAGKYNSTFSGSVSPSVRSSAAGWGSSHSLRDGNQQRHSSSSAGSSAAAAAAQKTQALGVLLTTSHVLRSVEDMEEATVCFLDQPMMGMAALLGHEPQPVRVRLCGSLGFVSSVAPPKENRGEDARRMSVDPVTGAAIAAAAAAPAGTSTAAHPSDDVPDYLLYAAAAAESSDDDEGEEIGFTMTYCEIFPSPTETPVSAAAAAAAAAAATTTPPPPTPSPSKSLSAPPASGSVLNSRRTSPMGGGLSSHRGDATGTSPASAVGGPPQDSLLLVQPLPVPLLLSTIPEIKVGDVHLMITHVNDGHRSYRVQHVAAVFADYCVYAPTGFGAVTSSGGPVFNTQGDFIGVQHERNTRSLCLYIKSIVRHLFDSDLLGMCRSPISAETVKARELHARPGDAAFATLAASRVPGAPSARGSAPPARSDVGGGFPVTPSSGNSSPVDGAGSRAGSRGGGGGGDGGASGGRLPPLPGATAAPSPPRSESRVTVEPPSAATTGSIPATSSRASGARGARQSPSRQDAGGSRRKSAKAAATFAATPETPAGSPVVTSTGATSVLSSTPASPTAPAKPLSQHVPSFEEVFSEFYNGAEALPHILYAFPHSLPLVKLTMESLAQLKYEDELENMAASGGVGAILETIDGYPHEEQIVAGALAALCRVCLYERNLVMFLHLDGVVTVMEVLKEYVHQPSVLQWGVYTLLFATDPSCSSAESAAELIVRSSAAQLLVNILRVHGSAQRKSAARRAQYNRLVRWVCDLIANILLTDPRRTTLLLREDFLTLLLQLCRDYAGNAFLMEGFAYVFSVFVHCFSETEVTPPGMARPVAPSTAGSGQYVATLSPDTVASSLLRDVGAAHPRRLVATMSSSTPGATSGAAVDLSYSPTAIAADPHKVSFFFLCDAMRHDIDGFLPRAVIDVCEAALNPGDTLTAHRGRPEVVLLRCLETLRLLLTWRLTRLPRGAAVASVVEGIRVGALASFPWTSQGSFALSGGEFFSEDAARLLLVCECVRRQLTSSAALIAKAEAVQQLLLLGS